MPSPARTDEQALYRPTPITDDAWADQQYQAALAVISDRRSCEWEARRAEREANIRKEIASWQAHIAGCIRRAAEYQAEADARPKAHKDHAYYRRLADEQREKAARARSKIEILEGML